jgi:hypothetical protein
MWSVLTWRPGLPAHDAFGRCLRRGAKSTQNATRGWGVRGPCGKLLHALPLVCCSAVLPHTHDGVVVVRARYNQPAFVGLAISGSSGWAPPCQHHQIRLCLPFMQCAVRHQACCSAGLGIQRKRNWPCRATHVCGALQAVCRAKPMPLAHDHMHTTGHVPPHLAHVHQLLHFKQVAIGVLRYPWSYTCSPIEVSVMTCAACWKTMWLGLWLLTRPPVCESAGISQAT